MSIPVNAIKVVLGGAMPGGEQWSSAFWVAGTVLHAVVELQNLLTDVNTQFNVGGGVYATLAGANPSAVTLPTLTAYQYDGGTQAAVQATKASSYTLGSQLAKLPNQCAVVMTLHTARPGRSYRGRMYIPLLALNMTTNNHITVGLAQTFNAALATAFGAFNSLGWGKVGVMSSARSAITPVTAISCDDVVDTQRRRRNSSPASVIQTNAVAP